MSGSVVQQVARSKGHDVSVPVATFSFPHTDSWTGHTHLSRLLQVWLVCGGCQSLTYIVDQAGSVSRLDHLHRSDSTSSVQGEALAPAGDAVWVDPLSNPHGTPEEREESEVQTAAL